MTYWPAGGGRGQNPENTGRIFSTGRALWARPVRQGFCPRPPPAGQYVLYAPLTVYRISGMLYYYNTLEQYFKKIQISGKF